MANYITQKMTEKKVDASLLGVKINFKEDLINQFEPFPLTDVQQAYMLGQNEAFTFGGVSTQCYFELECMNLDLPKAEAIFNELIAEHGMLRGVIMSDGQHQTIKKEVPKFEIGKYDFSDTIQTQQEAKLSVIRDTMSKLKYDRHTWPLYEIRHAKLNDVKSRLFISFDNILIDGWSMFYILKEWSYLYNNPDAQIYQSELSFRDYVLNYENLRNSGAHDKDWAYWMEKENELYPAPELPVEVGHVKKSQRFYRYQKNISATTWEAIQSKIKNVAITPAALLLSAYAEVIDRWSMTDKFSLNLTNFNRIPFHSGIEKLIGDFTALTIHGINMNAADSFLERTKIIQKKLWEDLNHSFVSGVEIERFLNKKGQSGLMPIVFTCGLGLEKGLKRNYDGYLGKMIYGLSHTPQVWLDNQVSEENGELVVSWDALQTIFPKNMIEEMFSAYINFIEKLGESSEIWDQEQGELIDVQNAALCESLNQTEGAISELTLIDYFYETVAKFPDKLAIESDERGFTYAQINKVSNALADKLLRNGVRRGDCIALYMHKNWQQMVAILAILKCGAIYLPLKYDNPIGRNNKILSKSEAKGVLLSEQEKIKDIKFRGDVWTLAVEEIYAEENIHIKHSTEDVAYIIYTSGTTGEPKGVAITNKAALNTILDVNNCIHASCEDKTIALSDSSFDLSVYDIFGMLLVGGSVVIPEHKKRNEPSHWLELVDKYCVTIWNSVPMYMSMYTEFIKGKSVTTEKNLRVILLSGDWIPLNIKQSIEETIGECELFGLGGATEAAIWSNIFKIDKICPEWISIPYGKPLKNQRYYIYDNKMRRRPNLVPGDLYIAGEGLADCYWKDQAATDASFIMDPITAERLYKTGDIAQYMIDGNVQFCGRKDNQVKINGFRIELEEINVALSSLLKTKHVTSIVINRDIISYIQPKIDYDLEYVMKNLRLRLPAYMLPQRIIAMDSIPLSENGKIDRKKLEQLGKIPPQKKSSHRKMTEMELGLKSIWESILETEEVGILENYISIGGDSLNATKIVTAIDQKYHIELSLNDFYDNPTISKLAEFLSTLIHDSEVGEI